MLGVRRDISWIPFLTGNGALLVRIGLDQTGINSKTFTTNQSFVDAALNNALKDTAKQIALTKSAVAVLRKCGLIRHFTVEIQPAEPAERQVQMDVLAQSTLGADAIAITNDQHAEHQLRIYGRTADLALKRLQILANTLKVDEDVDLAKEGVGRDMIVETKVIK